MAKKYTFKESVPFKYRFTCEHCGEQTDWINSVIEDEGTVEVGFLENAELKKAEFQEKFREGFYKYNYPAKKDNQINGKYNKFEDVKGDVKGPCPKSS